MWLMYSSGVTRGEKGPDLWPKILSLAILVVIVSGTKLRWEQFGSSNAVHRAIVVLRMVWWISLYFLLFVYLQQNVPPKLFYFSIHTNFGSNPEEERIGWFVSQTSHPFGHSFVYNHVIPILCVRERNTLMLKVNQKWKFHILWKQIPLFERWKTMKNTRKEERETK